LERKANEMEKDLSRRSEDFKRGYQKTVVTWEQVKSVLKKDEAAIEIVRLSQRKDHSTRKASYAALIVSRKTTEHPDVVVLENGISWKTNTEQCTEARCSSVEQWNCVHRYQ
jgi:hypothetical protein